MNRIEQLLAELCPEGVEFRALEKVLVRCENIKWAQQGSKEYKYIDLGSVDREQHKITEWKTVTKETAPSRAQQIVKTGDVIFGTTRPLLKRYCLISESFNGQIASTGYCILRANTEFVIPNYIFHIIGTEKFYDFVSDNERGASYPAIPDNVVKQFEIPIPPLAIQNEIVKILDKFVELQAELQAELQKRKIQYEYYRNALLTFPGSGQRAAGSGQRAADDYAIFPWLQQLLDIYCPNGVEFKALGEIVISISSGRNKQRINDESYPVYGSTGLLGYTDKPAYSGDALLVARVGANAGLVNAVSGDFDVSDNTLVVSPSSEWNVRFAFHQITHMKLNQYAVGGGQPLITAGLLKKLTILLPPIQVQECVAAILDKFDTLVNDLTIGLPAEIKARRIQYEYYRNQLLDFKEKQAVI